MSYTGTCPVCHRKFSDCECNWTTVEPIEKPPPESIVEVVWEDAAFDAAYMQPKSIAALKPITRRNIGYLIRDEPDTVVLTQGVMQNFCQGEVSYDGYLIIPRGMIMGIRKL